MARRKFRDAPHDIRCMATIILKDKSLAQCGRKRVVGCYCTQHSKKFRAVFSAALSKAGG